MMVEEHSEQEERYFHELQAKLSPEQRASLQQDILSAKSNAPLHPHPSAPLKPSSGSSILQPLTGTMERALEK